MEFNEEITVALAELDELYKEQFVDMYLAHYEILKHYAPTYVFLDNHEEPDNPVSTIEWIPSRIDFMMFSMNYRIVPLMEDIVSTLNKKHYLSTIVLSRALIEYAANINHYVKRLMMPTKKIMNLNKQGIKTNSANQIKQVRDIIIDFLARSRPHIDPTKRTNMEGWQKKKHNLRSPGISKIVKELPKEPFFKKDPYDLYHILCNYTHPNSESNQLVIVEFQESAAGTTFTLSRDKNSLDKKNYFVLLGFLNLIYDPILGSIRTITISLNQLNEISKVFKVLYDL